MFDKLTMDCMILLGRKGYKPQASCEARAKTMPLLHRGLAVVFGQPVPEKVIRTLDHSVTLFKDEGIVRSAHLIGEEDIAKGEAFIREKLRTWTLEIYDGEKT